MSEQTPQARQQLLARGIAVLVVVSAGVFVFFILQPSAHTERVSDSHSGSDDGNRHGSFIDFIVEETRVIGETALEAITHPETIWTGTGGTGESAYYRHEDISVTLFWVGERADEDNQGIPNRRSAWDDSWEQHYGGFDDPDDRNADYFPAGFLPKENPFYFALPYNDFDEDGVRRAEAYSVVPWAGVETWGEKESMLKNRWIKIIKGGKVAYAQWEDVGPFEEDDAAYVFGTADPKSETNQHAGLDLSPAVNDYLDLKGVDSVSWQFIEEADVPAGPWKEVVTRSQVTWK
ncbi:MAG: hypothetical protein WBO92_02375 [Candidatus Moraniibacteriota bacterium]